MTYEKTLVQKLTEISNDAGHVAKTGKNQAQGFNFRGIDAVVNALAVGMRASGVIVLPTILNYYYDQIAVGANQSVVGHVRLEVRYTFTDGKDSISAVVPGEAMDSGDKATAKAMSVAFRTALLQVFFLPTDEKDPDEDSYARTMASRHNHPSAAHVDEDAVPAPKTYGALDNKETVVRGLATEKQINFAKALAKKKGYEAEFDPDMSIGEMARFIDHLKTLADIK